MLMLTNKHLERSFLKPEIPPQLHLCSVAHRGPQLTCQCPHNLLWHGVCIQICRCHDNEMPPQTCLAKTANVFICKRVCMCVCVCVCVRVCAYQFVYPLNQIQAAASPYLPICNWEMLFISLRANDKQGKGVCSMF